MKLVKLSLISSILIISQVSASSFESDPFSVFTEELTPSYDIKLNTLEYNRLNEVNGRRGSFSFTNFNVVNSSIATNLNNEDGIYDADIYMINGRFGFVNENFKFAYKLRDIDFEYFDSIKFANILNTHFIMNRDEIHIDSEAIEFREPRTYIKATGYDVSCERHPDYLLNDGQGLMSGCFNYGLFSAKEGPGVDLRFKFYSQEDEEIINVNTYVESIKTSQDNLIGNGLSLEGLINNTTKLDLGEFSFECKKPNDLLKISESTFVTPCLSNLKFKAPNLKVSLLEEGDFFNLSQLDVNFENKIANLKIGSFAYSSTESVFNIGELKLKCDILSGDLTDIDTYMSSCLTKAKMDVDDYVAFNFNQNSISEKSGENLNINIDGKINNLVIANDKLAFAAKVLGLKVDEEVFLDFDNLLVNCQKDPGQLTLDIPLMLDYCKREMYLNTSDIRFHLINEKNESLRAQVESKSLNVVDGHLNFELRKIKMLDVESRKLMRNVIGGCKLLSDTDIFDVGHIISACSSNMIINIESVFTEESPISQMAMKSESFKMNNYKIEEKKAGLTDVRARITNNVLAASLKVRVLGMNLLVRIQGITRWNPETEVLTLEVTHSRLPLGITSRGFFMSIAKKFLQSDMIQFPSDNKINIQL